MAETVAAGMTIAKPRTSPEAFAGKRNPMIAEIKGPAIGSQ